jgi:exonuclease III
MRLVTWNCNGGFRRKLEQADTLNADVLVIQECEDPYSSTAVYRDWAGEYLWSGSNKNKGIGIFAKNGLSLEALNWDAGNLAQFFAARIGDRFNILAVWTQNSSPSSLGYIGQFWQYLQIHRPSLHPGTVILGDFNSNSIWDKRGRKWNHSNCVQELEADGFKSLYHLASGEAQGQETTPTFYLHRHLSRPFHIDYCFAHRDMIPNGWSELTLGDPQKWLKYSDHIPLIIDL